MFVSKLHIVSVAIALSLSLAAIAPGVAAADEVRVVVPTPFFVPHADFQFDDGYYRTHEGHYYHYDRDRDGWHYGRNHDEGVRFERRHGGRR